jgi:hypothetical protein
MRNLFVVLALLAAFGTALSGAVGTPGGTLQVTFTTHSNASDLLFFYTNDPLTVTGSPILTARLYNGATLLGTVTAPPYPFTGNQYFESGFRSPSSPFNPSSGLLADRMTTVDLTSLQNGTIQGRIEVTVSGGSISGFDTTHFVLYDAVGSGGGFTPQNNVTGSPVTITATSVPTLTEWGSALLAILLMAAGFRAVRATV